MGAWWRRRATPEAAPVLEIPLRYHVVLYGDGRAQAYVIEMFEPRWDAPRLVLSGSGMLLQSPSKVLLLRLLRERGKSVIEDADEWERFVYGAIGARGNE